MKIITTENRPIKSWCDNPEDGAIEQAKNLANLPFIFKHVALMPDTHQGYGMPIGGVIATKGVIVPNAVGVDIGCGMRALKLTIKSCSQSELKSIMTKIREKIPVGFNWHKTEQGTRLHYPDSPAINPHESNSKKQLGTLGGGNHFIEIQKGSDDHIWIMIHSGSRNLGKQVADYYNKEAIKYNELYCSIVPKEWQLAFLPTDTMAAYNYMRDMGFCLDYAKENRMLMALHCLRSFQEIVSCSAIRGIDIHHNYAAIENHYGEELVVHRKGATSAKKHEIGIIPGSQGTASYIVSGKGNPLSFESCSHGAGRKMGRKAAQKNLDIEQECQKLDDAGIIHSIRTAKDLDEAPGAYKDISTVMEEQSDLVDIEVELKPLAVIKG